MRFFAIPLFALLAHAQPFSQSDPVFSQNNSPLLLGCVGAWRLEEASGTRYDMSGKNNNLTSNNSVGRGIGKQEYCASFVRTSSQDLSVNDNSSIRFQSTGLTITAWINMTNIAGAGIYPAIVTKWKTTSGLREYQMYFDGDIGRFIFMVSTNATTGVSSVAANTLGLPLQQTWYFVAAGYDNTNVWFSVNGGAVDTTANTLPVHVTTSSLRIGGTDDVNFVRYFNGFIDEVTLYARTLRVTEIASLYNAGIGTHTPWAHP